MQIQRGYGDHPAGDGWALRFTLAGAGKLGVDGVASGNDFLVTLAASDTAQLAPGTYQYAVTATLSGARYTVETGTIAVLPDVNTATAGALQSHDEQVLALLEAELLARAASDHTEYTVDGRSLKRESITELNAWADRLRARIARRRAGGRLKMAAVTFTRPGGGA